MRERERESDMTSMAGYECKTHMECRISFICNDNIYT